MPEDRRGYREAVLADHQGKVSRVLEEAARWGLQGAESAQRTLNNNDILHAYQFTRAYFQSDLHIGFTSGLL